MDKKQRVIGDYGKSAKYYDKRYAATQFEKFRILDGIELNGLILDLGGGTGLLGKYLKRELVNVDSSFAMLKQSGEINICADIDYLPFKSACFDTILSFTALQNLPNFTKVFKEVRRVSKGKFICSVLNKIDVKELAREARTNYAIEKQIISGEDIQFILA